MESLDINDTDLELNFQPVNEEKVDFSLCRMGQFLTDKIFTSRLWST